MQILAVDLGTDMLPALGLGVEPPETDVMNRPPRRLTDRLLDKGLLIKSFLWYGTIESILAMGGFSGLITYVMVILLFRRKRHIVQGSDNYDTWSYYL